MGGDVKVTLPTRGMTSNQTRRTVTVTLRSAGQMAGQYSGGAGQVCPVVDGNPLSGGRQLGRVIRVVPAPTGAVLTQVVGDDDAWERLVTGAAKLEAVVEFERSARRDPVGGRVVLVEIV